MDTIYLENTQVPAHLRGNYSGRKFAAIVTDTVTIHSHDGLWDGGSRTTYSLVNIETGETVPASDNMSAPWDKGRQDRTVTLRPGFAAIRHSIFCGKDMGLTFYVHPENAAKLLPAPAAELSPYECTVLEADAALLTLSERSALGLAPEKKPRFAKSAAYRHVLVTFEDGYRQLAGYYPRVPDPDDMTPAIASARGRLLTLISGGRFNDASKAKDLPAIVSARIVTDPEELERERFWCIALREERELATPGFCPFPEGPAAWDYEEKHRLANVARVAGLSARFF